MRKLAAVISFLCAATLLRADQEMADVQQALKAQGFYYGEITGEKSADTSAAIRRFQIRHGLQVTGELNDETIRSIQESTPASPPPAATAAPSATDDTSDLRGESESEPEPAAPVQPFNAGPQRAPADSPKPTATPVLPANLFVGTPYENSPPDVQRNVVVSAQRALARRELFKHQTDGVFGPNLEFSLRAYQSRVGLHVTGRLDLETLAALELLPGANQPVYIPRRASRRPPSEQPPVRGEWIPD